MNHIRRRLLGFMALIGFKSAPSANAQTQLELSVKDFGAAGDGITDDYKAILAAISQINKNKQGKLVFPKGTYYIGRFKGDGQIPPALDMTFTGCSGVHIEMLDATIIVNGRFSRTPSDGSKSDRNTVIPLNFLSCRNITLRGGKLVGSARDMEKAGKVLEGPCHGLAIRGCENVSVQGTTITNFATDGIYITAVGENGVFNLSKSVTIDGVTCSHNGRQGMSIVGGNDIRVKNSKFLLTGHTLGKYGGHSPMAGVDIEPHRKFLPNGTTNGPVSFIDCEFSDNSGHNFVGTAPRTTAQVDFVGCKFTMAHSSSKMTGTQGRVNPTVGLATFKQCQFVNVCLSPGYAFSKIVGDASVVVSNCDFSFIEDGVGGPLLAFEDTNSNFRWNISNNRFHVEDNGQSAEYVFKLRGRNIEFVENSISITPTSSDASVIRKHFLLRNLGRIEGNRWTVSSKGAKKYKLVLSLEGSRHPSIDHYAADLSVTELGRK